MYNTNIPIYKDIYHGDTPDIYTENRDYLNKLQITEKKEVSNLDRAIKRYDELKTPSKFLISGNRYFNIMSLYSDLLFTWNKITYLDIGCNDCAITKFIGSMINKHYIDAKQHGTIYEQFYEFDKSKDDYTITATDIFNEKDVKFINKLIELDLNDIDSQIYKDMNMDNIHIEYTQNIGLSDADETLNKYIGKVNLITIFEALHHIEQSPYKVLEKIDKLLMEGGYIIIREHDVYKDDIALKNWLVNYHKNYDDTTVKMNSFTYIPDLIETMNKLGYQKIVIMTYEGKHNYQHIYYAIFRKKSKILDIESPSS